MKKLIAVGLACLFLASSTCYAGTIYACRKKVGGTIRIVGASTTCLATEKKMSWPDTAEVSALKAQNAAQQTEINALKTQMADLQSLLQHFHLDGNNLSINGANLWITDGSGTTDGAVNGLGNLIIGYNELRGTNDRTGSHNIVVGSGNNYSSYGGLVAGYWHTISGPYSTVSGGGSNTASGNYSSVSGGWGNISYGACSSVSAGFYNAATNDYSSVSGGYANTASGANSSVSGGNSNGASGYCSSVSGGVSRSVTGDGDWRAGTLFEQE